ncbi:MAG: hypothetical protein AUJ20_01620 [Comamonadaceae bacterium CG1_02_60_18]|nr:MAG: hypothetical protein AUJ20_01620 [Comamonadaceae bacterium CG1_02_60_18]
MAVVAPETLAILLLVSATILAAAALTSAIFVSFSACVTPVVPAGDEADGAGAVAWALTAAVASAISLIAAFTTLSWLVAAP